MNTYLYAGGNPVRFVDTLGLFGFEDVLSVTTKATVTVSEFAIATVGTITSLLSGDTRESDELPVIYYHYTNQANFNAIIASQSIKSGSKTLIYVSPCMKSPKEVENDLFIRRKQGFGDYVIAFRPKKGLVFHAGQNSCELIYKDGTLRFGRHIRVIYAGKNRF